MTEPDGPPHYKYMSFNAPLSEAHANDLADRLAATAPKDALDIGCGWGELLLRVVERTPTATGLGVDTDDRSLERGREAARQRGLDDRVTFLNTEGEKVSRQADLVICIGASHAFGGTAQALAALMEFVRPGGRLLFGDGLWDSNAVVENRSLVWEDMFELPNLGAMVDLAVDAGYRPLFIETSSTAELDHFESRYLADYEEWLMTHASHPRADEIRARADEHRQRWLHGYRSGFGFAYLTLGRPAA
jgi:cyclopropane fatty-acyl-phospholipid synthase-like methyltransferase